ncbi:tumor necrosis factor ligand superfamily member 12 [Denticeps clupeoides]|uniref:tumor necrosis factor ligand superfamily member 12 n=1 Tax=Denticeps clupeoides TaxID=299321 RepID=UPI0010A3349A|nr:tumor necrosis factor ligand superfamily member 12 [Denticeps clupeoides]
MHRGLQQRKMRKLRFVWAAMAAFALLLAGCSAVFTVWTWRQTRDLSRSFSTLQERVEQVNTQRKEIVQLILEKRAIMEGSRMKREVAAGKVKNGKKVASHFEITKSSFQSVGQSGLIRGWEEEALNMTRAVMYNPETGIFRVERNGVYFLYCQVHFNENKSPYVKLEVSVSKGPSLQCMEGHGTTPSSAVHNLHFLKPCQVSGLLRLNRGAELQTLTSPNIDLRNNGKHYFGLFKIN